MIFLESYKIIQNNSFAGQNIHYSMLLKAHYVGGIPDDVSTFKNIFTVKKFALVCLFCVNKIFCYNFAAVFKTSIARSKTSVPQPHESVTPEPPWLFLKKNYIDCSFIALTSRTYPTL